MRTRWPISGVRVLLASLAGGCLCCSCAVMDTRSPEDAIGPKGTGPNGVPAPAPAPTPSADARPAQAPASDGTRTEGPLSLTVTQATLLALENNRSLVVERLNPQIERTLEQEQRAVFDPFLTGQVAGEHDKVAAGTTPYDVRGESLAVGVQDLLPTGTTLGLSGATAPVVPPGDAGQYASRLAFTATQSLLRGLGPAVNLASVRQAGIDVKMSQYELRGFVQGLVAQVEETYWDFVLAERQIEIVTQSLDLAEKQLQETRERIHVGALAQSELAAAEAEVALRREGLINARSDWAKIKLNLLRLVNPPGDAPWGRDVVLQSPPVIPSITLDEVASHVALALQMRPDLNQARLLWQRDDLDVVKTKNGLLPKLDLFVALGKTGYADSFGGSVQKTGGDNYDAIVGLAFEAPPLNRAAEARRLRAVLTRQQAREAIHNLAQLIEVDVRIAYLELARSQEQVAATAATGRLQEQKLQSETEKFHLGKSTSLLVAQAQRDLLASRISEVQAVVGYLKAMVEIYRLEGSLLERQGIAGPGREPVRGPDGP